MAINNPFKYRKYKGKEHYGDYADFVEFKAQVDVDLLSERLARLRHKQELNRDIQFQRTRFTASIREYRIVRSSAVSLVIDECILALNEACGRVWVYDSSEHLQRDVDALISQVKTAFDSFRASL